MTCNEFTTYHIVYLNAITWFSQSEIIILRDTNQHGAERTELRCVLSALLPERCTKTQSKKSYLQRLLRSQYSQIKPTCGLKNHCGNRTRNNTYIGKKKEKKELTRKQKKLLMAPFSYTNVRCQKL